MKSDGAVSEKVWRKWWLWGIVIGSLVVLSLILFWFYPGLPEVSPSADYSPPLVVNLRVVGGSRSAPWQAPVEVIAEVYSAVPVTDLRFFVNGEQIETYTPPEGANRGTVAWQTNWQSAAPGSYLLVVQAVAADGAVASSNVISFYRMVAADPYIAYTAGQGDTLETIAAAYGVEAGQLTVENPQVVGNGGISPGEQIHIPIELPVPDASPVEFPIVEPAPGSNPLPGKLTYWWQNLIGSDGNLPQAPEIALYAFEQQGDCGVQVHITDLAENESGYFIYQASAANSIFELVGAVGSANGGTLIFDHPGQSGHLMYYAAAFNAAGEAASLPASIDLSTLGCGSQNSPGVQFAQNRLTVERPVDWVYLYFSMDEGAWQRVPQGEGEFIVSDGRGYDLSPYLENLLDDAPSHRLKMEVWGWANGNLVYLGNLVTVLSQTDLIGCGHAGECREGLGWTNAVWIEPDEEDREREFRWVSNVAGASGGIYQVASQPFPDGTDLKPPGLLLSGDAGAAVEGNPVSGSSFSLDFGQLSAVLSSDLPLQEIPAQPAGEYGWLLPLLEPIGPSMEYITPGETEPTFYVRVIPMAGNQPTGGASNPVTVVYQPAGEQENPLVEIPVPPELYDIEIVDFTPIIPPTLDFGCVYITDIDYDTFMISAVDMLQGVMDGEDLYEKYKTAYENHTPICPEPYKGVGEPAWYESFVDFLGGAAAWLAEVYSDIKAGVIDAVAAALDGLPLVDCDDSCRYLLEKGLDAGMLALGIPPELPNLEQLTDQGLNYLVEVAVEEMGVPCDEECRQIIRDGIKDMAQQVARQNVEHMCGDVAWAHDHAIEPMCFPDGITVEIAPESMTQPPLTVVRITRRMEPAEVDVDLSQYQFFVSFMAETDLGDGERVQVNTGFYEGGYSVQDFSEYLPLDGPVTGAVFRSAEGSIPAMQPGESIELTLVQQPAEYWLPGHKDLIAAEGGFVRFDDFWKLYYQGHLTIQASVVCPDNSQYFPTTQSCGGGDVYETILPNE